MAAQAIFDLPKSKTSNKRVSVKAEDLPRIYSCSCCGIQLYDPDVFYKNPSNYSAKANDSYVHMCKDCVSERFEEFCTIYDDEKIATIMLCAMLNYYFDEKLYIKTKSDKTNYVFGDYVKVVINSKIKKTFSDTLVELLQQEGSLLDVDNSLDNIENKALTPEEIEAKDGVITIIGYDPWVNYPLKDRKYLFRELVKYFDDDEISEDAYKLTVIIQIVESNNQIRKYNEQLVLLDPVKDIEKIKSLNASISSAVQNVDKLAKENEISVKNRSNKEVGKNTLTFLMKKLRELDFEKAEVDFYDQLQSKGTQWAVDMSFKAISENAYFTENDWIDIGGYRRDLVDKLYKENDDLKEEKRKLYVEIQKLKEKLGEFEDVE